jgi:Autotransporter beta-domain
MDYRISPDNIVGFALGRGGTNWGVSDGLGSGTSHMFQAGLYSFNRWGPVYLSAAVADSAHEANTTRTVTIAGTDTLTANFNANVISARVEGGYRYGIGTSGITPYAAAQGQWMHVPSYSESATAGSSALALSYGSQNPTDVRSELGSWLDCGVPFDGGALLPLYGVGPGPTTPTASAPPRYSSNRCREPVSSSQPPSPRTTAPWPLPARNTVWEMAGHCSRNSTDSSPATRRSTPALAPCATLGEEQGCKGTCPHLFIWWDSLSSRRASRASCGSRSTRT